MKIAIHPVQGSFSDYWIKYCQANEIPYKIVNCYQNNIIEQLIDCDVLMWHFYHAKAQDYLMAKQLLYAVSSSGKVTFPNFNTSWHFDDKVGQKYLLESIQAPLVPSYVFFNKDEALEWAANARFPKVFKLRGGAGSVNVKLVKNRTHAIKLIKRAFGKGFKHDSLVPALDLFNKFLVGKATLFSVFKGLLRPVKPTLFSKIHGKERGYIYFQDFIADNDHDIRVIVINEKAFAIKRMVRKNDFRASGSGDILYEKELFDDKTLKLSFEMAEKLRMQCVAFDFVYQAETPMVVEISYGFSPVGYGPCPGFWDKDLNWHAGEFDPYGWMVEEVFTDR
ncbi:MAG: hypothetical protein HXX14_12925 [Bacteroidetes bacterium]|nr:hypothetical protein [Bacteroidota bacterium]